MLYLGAYALLQLGLIAGRSYSYAGLNLTAASCVLIGLAENFNLASAVVNFAFVVISLVGITRIYLRTTGLRFSDEERALLNATALRVPNHMNRRLLDAGSWHDGQPGDVLIPEGKPAAALVFFLRGEAAVSAGGTRVASIEGRTGWVRFPASKPHPPSRRSRSRSGPGTS